MVHLRLYAFIVVFLSLVLLPIACKENGKPQETVHRYTNALVTETSPYLLQHAHNPVNWRPWSPEALEEAEKEQKLVLVSIGYSSCHWCHVMEAETFEDEEVAKIMNDNFISIKVDREERPDIDQVYMTAVQLINGNGGWPLNVITLPNGKPLYGGTYHTKEQWKQVLTKISGLYMEDPLKASEYADMVAQGISEANRIIPSTDSGKLTKETLGSSIKNWKPYWDTTNGGDSGSQKFMIPVNLNFLLDYAQLSDDEPTLSHVKLTLDKMAHGGIYDDLGGGFFRYSTDPQWKVPHFEKMLYDNAQAISLYSKAYSIFKDEGYKDIVFETIDFLNRSMRDSLGGYHAAMDADSEGEEGKYYVWQETELKSALGNNFDLFAAYYDIAPGAIWENGNYVLHRPIDDQSFAQEQGLSLARLKEIKSDWRQKLMVARGKRVAPRVDDKMITSWNALMINALVDAYKVFGGAEQLDEAEKIYQFLEDHCLQGKDLVHSYKVGSQQKQGFLEDYAFLANACLKLYGVTFDLKYLERAQSLTQTAKRYFADSASGLYRFSRGGELIANIIKTDDGVMPSPNAVMAHTLFEIGHLLYDTDMLGHSQEMLSTMVPFIEKAAPSYALWNELLLHHTYPYFEVAVVGNDARKLVKALNQNYLPNALVVGSTVKSDFPLFKDRYFEDGTFIYVCQETTCKLPVTTVEKAIVQIKNF
ncbi:MAG: thioredoxin domain-containing protein [Flavobacteriaceae bacterium]